MRSPRTPRQRGSVGLGLTGTIVVHAAAVVLLVAMAPRREIAPPVYAVNLVAAPAPAPVAAATV
ncbi:MAG: hypothetical protein ACHQXA_11155, partial [Gemmatimonadales bacterium]